MAKDVDEDDVLAAIEAAVERAGSAKVLAETAGLSVQYLCDIRKGRRPPSDALLAYLGYERVAVIRKLR